MKTRFRPTAAQQASLLLACLTLFAGCSGDSAPDEIADSLGLEAVTQGDDPEHIDDEGVASNSDPLDSGTNNEEAVSALDNLAEERVLSAAEIEDFKMPPVLSPEEVLPQVEEDRGSEIDDAVDRDAVRILDAAPIEVEPTASELASVNDGLPRNSFGRLISLDEAAALTCSNVEVAITALDDGDTVASLAHVGHATRWATQSSSKGMERWAEVLQVVDGSVPDAVMLVGFLEACVAGGYEL